jgi:hypothetical protein
METSHIDFYRNRATPTTKYERITIYALSKTLLSANRLRPKCSPQTSVAKTFPFCGQLSHPFLPPRTAAFRSSAFLPHTGLMQFPAFLPQPNSPSGPGPPQYRGFTNHTQTHHTRQDSSGRVISPMQRPLPDNTQHLNRQTSVPPVGFVPAIPASE